MFRRAHILMVSIAVSMGVLAIIGAVVFNAKLVDPDGFIGPSYLRLPTILALGFGIDLVPRTLWVSRCRPGRMPTVFRERLHSHWTRQRIVLVVSGILCFYITYVSYRNLKSQLPFIEGRDHKFDRPLFSMDKSIFLGHEPAIVLHNLLGDGISAEFLSSVYLWFLPLVPLALAVWLVWSRNIGFGYWFAASQCLAWTLGTISYFALPTLGPGFQHPWLYQTVENTNAGRLMNSLANSRVWAVNTSAPSLEPLTSTLSGVAGFASLHVAITLLVALMIQYTTTMRWLKIVFWVNTCCTAVATLYFGWHYVADDVAGVAIALFSFYVGGWASGQTFVRHRVTEVPVPE
ncbi:MAG TPA: phosphatase PAP2 family protein [Nocardioides sp.]|uniref:phosphatase PAP2 family protein n=1 Tax=Nocardioides sp. TaxID=35761 RepID=UPI002E34EF6C|nr:phosphatase PAP2 family protein [Nocardioides sp.]HEX3929523.1 phosphatase PAP2 family protein [Nocardioides sp.]